ncbi:eukaryotic translation initiation factor 5B isoform X2 [Hyalella azteca]|uniref:Eukaryotic translation initiation factor 5B isoform X2 n=1 Tax=Hyalella azteca TaxID=294128 RepID=A0A8B7NQM0_HYAAZ|nr:eukaryotic translation initiation factor 5B isoform X2 [Hyalella azteca]XP_018015980.1 eukaryotic translation initiation factor 5B isoform X2 [Hyalella azteca]
MGVEDEKSTEIRAEEKSRGGMSYEVILSQAVTERPSSPAKSPSPPPARSITQQDIENKLELAEQRRKALEAQRVASIGERLCRLEEAARKRQEANDEFICSTATALDLKLDASSVNREAHLDGLKAKVADHLNSVETVRKSVEEQTEKLREEILSKMSSAQENRDDHLRTIMAKLQAHEASVQRVRESHDRAVRDLEERIRIKQEVATDNREAEIEKKLEALRNHLAKVEDFKENLNKKHEEQSEKLRAEIASYEAKVDKIRNERNARPPTNVLDKIEKIIENKEKEHENRMKEVEEKIKAKFDLVEKNRAEMAEKNRKIREEQERRAEAVRANKEKMTASTTSDDISSG